MSVVVDSSVLVAALVDTGPNGTWAEGVLAHGLLHAPELARVEATNVLRRCSVTNVDSMRMGSCAERRHCTSVLFGQLNS